MDISLPSKHLVWFGRGFPIVHDVSLGCLAVNGIPVIRGRAPLLGYFQLKDIVHTWLVQSDISYGLGRRDNRGYLIRFYHPDHAMLFKLTWSGHV